MTKKLAFFWHIFVIVRHMFVVQWYCFWKCLQKRRPDELASSSGRRNKIECFLETEPYFSHSNCTSLFANPIISCLWLITLFKRIKNNMINASPVEVRSAICGHLLREMPGCCRFVLFSMYISLDLPPKHVCVPPISFLWTSSTSSSTSSCTSWSTTSSTPSSTSSAATSSSWAWSKKQDHHQHRHHQHHHQHHQHHHQYHHLVNWMFETEP